MSTTSQRLPGTVIYISHGGGPLPLLGDPAHNELVAHWKELANHIHKPAAILVISAHWEESLPTITSGAHPPLLYDYYGFPPESYTIQYPAPGNPQLAKEIYSLLKCGDIEARLDEHRGFDHGVFVPLKLMYPHADIPCVQLSLVKGLNPQTHIRMGKALSPILKEGVLIIGSGFSFHNLQAFFMPTTPVSREQNAAFEHWLIHTCASPQLSLAEREDRLVHWEDAPAARYCHPREEHLMPLHVCFGAAGTTARQVYTFHIMEKLASAYLW